jgi:RHS repeat-associated protein
MLDRFANRTARTLVSLSHGIALLISGCQLPAGAPSRQSGGSDEAGTAATELEAEAIAASTSHDPAATLHDDLPPDGGSAGEVGTLRGSFRVSDDGVATYSLPLPLPITHASVQPQLEVRYSSSSGNGLLGAGFSLGGFSAISRCPKTPVPDGERSPVRLDASDALCLDGSRLVLVAGDHLAEGAEYRTESESFVRVRLVIAADGTEAFVVDHPSGRQLSFGTESQCRQVTRDITSSWALCQIEDTFKNHTTFRYHSSTAAVVADNQLPALSTIEHRPSEIHMWGHGGRNGRLAVRFDYGIRSDRIESHTSGGIRRTSHLLHAIKLFDPDGLIYRSYNFDYSIAETGRSRLDAVEMCGGTAGNVCMPPMRFEYTDNPPDFAIAEANDVAFSGWRWPNPHQGDHRITAVNVNGDAFDDLVFRSEETNTWHIWQGGPGGDAVDSGIVSPDAAQQEWFPTRFRGFVNDDSREDLVVVDAQLDGPLSHLSILFGSEYQGVANLGGPLLERFGPEEQLDAPTVLAGTWIPQMTAADFNGDGLLDFAICHGTAESSTWTIYESTAHAPGTWVRNHTETAGTCAFDDFIVVDFDGDRAANLLRIEQPLSTEESPYVALVQDPQGAWNEVDTGLPRDLLQRLLDLGPPFRRAGQGSDIIADLNGDGLSDIARLEAPGGSDYAAIDDANALANQSGHIVSYLNTGAGFRRGPRLWPPEGELGEVSYARVGAALAMDISLDGATDIIVDPVEGSPHFAIGIRAAEEPGTYRAFYLTLNALANATRAIGPFDFNGDGLPDLVSQQGAPPELPNDGFIEVATRIGERPNLLTRVMDGYGATIDIDYAPLRRVHERDPNCEDNLGGAVECVNDARPVVRFETHDTGTHNISGGVVRRTIEHSYSDGRRHRLGRDWLGFGRHSYSATDDLAPDVLTRVEMDNHTFDEETGAFPFAHRQRRVTRETEVVDGIRHVVDDDTEFVVRTGTDSNTWYPARELVRTRHFEVATPPGDCDPHQDCAIDVSSLDGLTPSRQTEAWHEYDSFGNTTLITTTRLGGSTSVVEKEYANDTVTWRLGQMTSRTETSTVGEKSASRRSEFSYDPDTGALDGSIVAPGHPTYELHTEILRDDYGNVALSVMTNRSDVWSPPSTILGEARTVATEYDSLGVFPEVVTNGEGFPDRLVHSYRHGAIRRMMDANGGVVDTSYDDFGRVVQRDRFAWVGGPSSGISERTSYERISPQDPETKPPSRLRRVEDTPGNSYMEIEFDRLERPTRRAWYDIEGELVVQKETYTPAGLPLATEVPHRAGDAAAGSTERRYDSLGRLRNETAPDGATSVATYPTSGEEVFTDPAGRSTHTWHNTEDQIVRSEDHVGTPTCFTYGPFGVMLELRRGCSNNGKHWTKATFDSWGRRTWSEDPNEGARSFEFDGFGMLARITDAAGSTTTFTYDSIGRQIARSDADGETRWVWDRDSDGGFIGKLRSSISPSGVENHYTYDAFGRPRQSTRKIGSTTISMQYGYDEFGREATLTMPDSFGVGFSLRREFTDEGHLFSVVDADSGDLYWAQTEQHPAGMARTEYYGNGLATWREYDATSLRPESIVTSDEEGEFEVQGLVFSFNADGSLDSRGDATLGQNETFKYDSLGRLTSSTATRGAASLVVKQTYDNFGNLTSRTGTGAYVYGDRDRPDRVTNIAGVEATYDLNGNLKKYGAALSIEYTDFNVPKKVTTDSAVTRYTYDAEGDRAQRTSSADNSTTVQFADYQVRRWGLQAAREHRYSVRAQGRVVAEVTRSNAAEAGIPGPLGFVERTRYFHDDHLGSPSVITNEVGAVVQRLSFEGFGRSRNEDWTSVAPPAAPISPAIGFTGLPGEVDGGLIAMHGRWYHPHFARFLSPDPFTAAAFEPNGQNRYAYTWNQPLSLTDRTGFSPDCCIDGVDEPRVVVVETETGGGGWIDLFLEWVHGFQAPDDSDGFWFSVKQVIDAVAREDQYWDKAKAGVRTAGGELLAHAGGAMDRANDFHSGVLDGTNPGLTQAIREAVVPGVTNYDSTLYGVGKINGLVASTAASGGSAAIGIARAWQGYKAAKAGAAVATTSQVGKAAGSGTGATATKASAAATSAAADSNALAKALLNAGDTRGPSTAAHHIVAGNAPLAARARAVLDKFGIGINDAINGVFLPANRFSPNAGGAAVHASLHTTSYFTEVNRLLSAATSRAEAELILGGIRSALLAGGL